MVHALSPKRRRQTGRRGGQPFDCVPAPSASERASSGGRTPLMPNERDTVAEGSTSPTPPPEVKRAFHDVRRGLVDTDKGPVLDHAYRKLRTGGSSGN